ncbi:hypothetical protein B0H10DRAFT_2168799 [Mycena sp. CBHHK59/15]|nr:hypothetical protein B0H10DRAFT_2168799 [Mycena sp. CBHHK59/15]
MEPIVRDPAAERERLRAQVERMLSESEQNEEDDITLGETVDALKDLDLEDEDEIDEESYFSNIPVDRDYSPYPNKVTMLLDIYDNFPRIRMSSNQLKMILWILKECKVANVPSYYAFHKMQDDLRGLCGSEPKSYTSSVGNRFFVNISDFANPEVAKHLQFYPEETAGPISEVWQAERWKEFKPSELTPMYARGLRQFYIEEVAELDNGKMVIPLAWIKRGGVICADCVDAIPSMMGWKIGLESRSVPASSFQHNYHDIIERIGDKILWADDANAPEMPNPLRKIAAGNDLYVVMVPIWADDVSGNKSKQYNKHINIILFRFVSTSPHATSPEQFSAVKDQIHRGPSDFTESNDGYHSMHYAGLPRFAAQTKATLEEQIRLAMYGVEAPISRLQTATGVKDKVTQHWIDILLEKARQMKADSPWRSADSIAKELKAWLEEQPGDKVNPLLDIAGLDPNRDTPVELLHTILLGIIKAADLFVVRLQSTDIDGLTIPPIRAPYMMQYRNGLIGKHFKTLMQTMVFHVHDLVSPEIFTLIKAVSALGAVLWVHEIDDMAQYTADLIILIGNVLDAFGDYDPAKILLKIKLHLLPHIVEDAVRFGPPIRNSTEVFECFNAIFRLCSVLSNHQAPSRDIAFKFASMDRVKHILSGGFWKQGDEWVCAGSNVRSVLKTMPIIQRHLGWVPPRKLVPGDPVVFNSVPWRSAISVVAQSGDSCCKGSWVFARDSNQDFEGIPNGVVIVDRFVMSEKLHSEFGMPIRSCDVQDIFFRFSAQHDCRLVKCLPTALRPVIQEHQETSRFTHLISHGDDEHFVINMAALHNATLLRRILPVALTLPRALYLDRKAHHHELAVGLRVSQLTKRARTQEKRQATLAAKKHLQRGINSDDEQLEEEEEEEEMVMSAPPKKRQRKAQNSAVQ